MSPSGSSPAWSRHGSPKPIRAARGIRSIPDPKCVCPGPKAKDGRHYTLAHPLQGQNGDGQLLAGLARVFM